MNIRARLSLTFFAIVVVVLIISSVAIYFFAESDRKADFYRRLKNRSMNTAMVLTEIKEVNAELQRRLEKNNPASLPDQYIVIVDSLGREIYRSTGPDRLRVDSATLAKINLKEEIVLDNENGEGLGFLFHNSNGRYVILATAFDQFGHQSIDNLRSILVLTFVAAILLVSVLSWFYSGRVLKPIAKIIADVGNISEKNLNLRLDEGNQTDELSRLAKTFNDMLSRLQLSFLSQKSFIANASHEIKTPITIMSGEIEVALLQERDNRYYSRILNSVLSGLKNLNNLSTQLLLLAESTSQDSKRKFTSFRLDDIIWETKDWLLKAYPHYRVEIQFDISIDTDAFSMLGDEHLVRAALYNLMDNGCKYSIDNHVSLMVDTRQPGWLRLSFVNSGMIMREELQKIFSPFYRSAVHKTEKGFGIGLSLVANVVKLHNGELSVKSESGITEFNLKLPISQHHGESFQPPPSER
jgi:signal transduction histidine kinase